MNKYEQLESILNKCIEKWRLKWTWAELVIVKDWTVWIKWAKRPIMSFNDLFSVDSWLMEFVEWKSPRNLVLPWWWPVDMTEQQMKWIFRSWHYKNMSDITAEQKVDYFLENIIDE